MSPTYPHISQREGPENTTICASQIFEMLGRPRDFGVIGMHT